MLGVHPGGPRPTRSIGRSAHAVRDPQLRPAAGPLVGLAAQVVVLAALTGAGVGLVGWLFGVAYGLSLTGLLIRALIVSGSQQLGPADKVTLARSALVGGTLAMVVSDFNSSVPAAVLVTMGAVALVLDGVDGKVARYTRTASAFGARFDMEIDAVLILILSVHAAPSVGWWVLLIGAARFLFLAASFKWPWLRGNLPRRYWAKVVAVIQVVVLLIVATGLLPPPIDLALCLLALVLLAESFARSVWWLASRRTLGGGNAD